MNFSASSPCDSELLCETERRLPVDDAEIDGLGASPLLGRDFFCRKAQDFGGRTAVDIGTLEKRFDQSLVAGQVCQDPQFHLGIVGREHRGAFSRDKGSSDGASHFCPNRYVLEIGVAA